jgi:hypothetical protein
MHGKDMHGKGGDGKGREGAEEEAADAGGGPGRQRAQTGNQTGEYLQQGNI